MLGRGHLTILRQQQQGHGQWPERESFVTGREDMVLMDGQLERDSLLEFCPKSRPQKYFSPPKRPWDFSKASQPKRLWDFSPPFCKERLQVNTRSSRRMQDPKEQYCCGSLDAAGVCSMGGRINSNHLSSSVHRCTTVRLAENGDSAATRPQSNVSRCHVDQANVKQGFWPPENETLSVSEAALKQDDCLPSTFDPHAHSFTKEVTEQQTKASQLSAKVEFDIQEIEKLKAQMALLCERLSWHISRWSKDHSNDGIVSDSFDSEESLLLTRIGELKRVIGVPTSSSESRREQGKSDLEADYVEGRETEEICRCRNLAWKSGIGTIFQSILWCIGFMITIVRCNHGGPELTPT